MAWRGAPTVVHIRTRKHVQMNHRANRIPWGCSRGACSLWFRTGVLRRAVRDLGRADRTTLQRFAPMDAMRRLGSLCRRPLLAHSAILIPLPTGSCAPAVVAHPATPTRRGCDKPSLASRALTVRSCGCNRGCCFRKLTAVMGWDGAVVIGPHASARSGCQEHEGCPLEDIL